GVRDRERGRVRLVERDVAVPGGTLGGHGEHVRAAVHADDRALAPDRLKQLGDVETRATAHVKDTVAGSCAERSPHQLPSAQHVARGVKPLQPPCQAPIELQLTHFATHRPVSREGRLSLSVRLAGAGPSRCARPEARYARSAAGRAGPEPGLGRAVSAEGWAWAGPVSVTRSSIARASGCGGVPARWPSSTRRGTRGR